MKHGQFTIHQATLEIGKDLLDRLTESEIVKTEGEEIRIEFLDMQMEDLNRLIERRREAGRKGGQASAKQIEASAKQNQASAKQTEADKIRLDKIREDNRLYAVENCLPTDNQKNMFEDFLSYWFEIGMNDKKHRFEKEKSFNWVRRWNTWLKNNEKWNKEKSSAKKESDNFSISKIEV